MSRVVTKRRYSLADAAYEVLRLVGNPMYAADLADAALRNGLVPSATPGSLNAAIWREIQHGSHSRFVKTAAGYGLREWGVSQPSAAAAPRDAEEADLLSRIRDRLRAIRRFTRGTDSGVDTETICMWIELCFVLELHSDVIELFNLLPEESTDPSLYPRARKMVRVSRMKEESQGG